MGQIRDFFQIRFKYIWLTEPNELKSDLEKSPGFVPFWANLTHFVVKPDIPDTSPPDCVTRQFATSIIIKPGISHLTLGSQGCQIGHKIDQIYCKR